MPVMVMVLVFDDVCFLAVKETNRFIMLLLRYDLD